ncbi:DUF2459 domain-containing protein [Aureispira sp. CCB-E]|uniref:DUF2459 domain-containing protein n=1 Tax=Aureispira sp. CCB-E TaxID=3051121 RepID=UPI0028688965|nr:DUF2459 domain-containing protein [Aureispira sp. CCB-E]WMX15733.1 DUF2459 domain-containing protein [Aureispira sp. CCB-E]
MKIILFRLTKYLLIFLVVCLVFVLNYIFFAWFLSRLTTTPKDYKCDKPYTVYATSNGVHMDLIFHKSLLDEAFLVQLQPIEGDYIAIGWGDKGFYLHTPSWAELKISTAIAAGFLPSKTLMHLTHYKYLNSKWKSIELCDEQLAAMKKFVYESFKYDKKGTIQILEGTGYRDNDFFYEAKGNYTCLYTCNIWVNQALKKAAVKTAIWSPFDRGILRHLSK